MPGVGDAGTGHCVKQQRSPASLTGGGTDAVTTRDRIQEIRLTRGGGGESAVSVEEPSWMPNR